MKHGRILILGQSKENSFEIRNLFDDPRYELEIALSRDTGKVILASRRMDLMIIHTEVVDAELVDFLEELEDDGISVPTMLLGEEATALSERLPNRDELRCYDKPYPVEDMLSFIRSV